jgi:hypothetical protein
VDCLVPFLFVNIQMCTDIKLPEKPEHAADQVGKMWTCVQGAEVQIPVAIPTIAVFFSFSRRMPRQYLELGPVASFQIAFRIVCAFNDMHDTLQASRILRWLLDCGKSVHP